MTRNQENDFSKFKFSKKFGDWCRTWFTLEKDDVGLYFKHHSSERKEEIEMIKNDKGQTDWPQQLHYFFTIWVPEHFVCHVIGHKWEPNTWHKKFRFCNRCGYEDPNPAPTNVHKESE